MSPRLPWWACGAAEGSGLAFESQGLRDIKGLERPIEVYRLID